MHAAKLFLYACIWKIDYAAYSHTNGTIHFVTKTTHNVYFQIIVCFLLLHVGPLNFCKRFNVFREADEF